MPILLLDVKYYIILTKCHFVCNMNFKVMYSFFWKFGIFLVVRTFWFRWICSTDFLPRDTAAHQRPLEILITQDINYRVNTTIHGES